MNAWCIRTIDQGPHVHVRRTVSGWFARVQSAGSRGLLTRLRGPSRVFVFPPTGGEVQSSVDYLEQLQQGQVIRKAGRGLVCIHDPWTRLIDRPVSDYIYLRRPPREPARTRDEPRDFTMINPYASLRFLRASALNPANYAPFAATAAARNVGSRNYSDNFVTFSKYLINNNNGRYV